MRRIVNVLSLALGLALASQALGRTPPATQPDRSAPREAFEKLLDQLDAVRLDPALADGDEILAARAAVKAAIDQFQAGLNKSWNDEHGMPLADRDHVVYRNACLPRLDGTVVKVGPGERFPDVAAAVSSIHPGTLVVLGPGEFKLADFGRGFNFSDIAIVGQGPQATTLANSYGEEIDFAMRALVGHMRVDCKDSPFIDLRRGGAIAVRDCSIGNYNSGAGGSNSIFTNEGMLLLEGCAFDGAKGRAGRPGSGGDALDMRGDWRLYARQCQFIENEEIVRATAMCVFDGCMAVNASVRGTGVTSFATGLIVLKDSQSILDASGGKIPGRVESLAFATDDLAVATAAAGSDGAAPKEAGELASTMSLSRRLPYWIGLLRHEDPRIRAIAKKRLGELVDFAINLPAEPQAEHETLADLGVLFKCEVEFTRVMSWLEKNQAKLLWDAAAGRYRLENP